MADVDLGGYGGELEEPLGYVFVEKCEGILTVGHVAGVSRGGG